MLPLSNALPLSVTVCGVASLLVQLIVPPGFKYILAGLKAKFWMVAVAVATGLPGEPPPVGFVLFVADFPPPQLYNEIIQNDKNATDK